MHWLRWRGVAALVIAIVAAGRAAWAARRFEMAVTTRNAFLDTRDIPSPLVGKSAPNFTLPLAGGGTAELAAYRGRPVLVVFWSSF